tara:strand:+ start:2985 stop:3479 length:495 start_codon:yes stop_codon:yes gene_type:complete
VACGTNSAGGFNSFQSPDGRYAFLYPTGWTRVAVNNGPQVVFHDLINSDETLSLVVSDVGGEVNLELLGSADEVGKRLISQVIAPEGAVRQVELVKAAEREYSSHTFYDLEYIVHLPERDRHELSTVVVDRGSLYTFATSTNQVRWDKMKNIFERVIQSFEFLV